MVAMIDTSTTNGHYDGASDILPLCLVTLHSPLNSKNCGGKTLRAETCFEIMRSV